MKLRVFLSLFLILLFFTHGFAADKKPVFIGIDGAFGHVTSTSERSIKQGVLLAIDEINRAGGVLGGRKLALIEKDNRSVPARGVKNIKEFAAHKDLVAYFCGKFSPVAQEEVPLLGELSLPLLDPWAAADNIVDNGQNPNYAFRLSLKDSWAMAVMMDHALKRGKTRVGLLLPITGWGRSNSAAAQKYVSARPEMAIADVQWYNFGDKSLIDKYMAVKKAGADVIIMVANEAEGSVLVRELAGLPEKDRLPVISHWGITGGNFVSLSGKALEKVDLSVVQTYSFIGKNDEKTLSVLASLKRLFKINRAEDILSPVGLAHAYDLTHILARALELAGSTDRKAVRDALEKVIDYDGLIKRYDRPFTEERHEALRLEDLFMAKFGRDGKITPITDK